MRQLLKDLAECLERNISDTVRFAVRKTARDYGLLPAKSETVNIATQTEDLPGE